MKTILFDIDGTLANLNGREKFLKQEKPDWQNFNAKMEEDLPNTPIVELYRALYESKKFEIILVLPKFGILCRKLGKRWASFLFPMEWKRMMGLICLG